MPPDPNSGASLTRLWTTVVEATFVADNAEDAEAVAKRLNERVLEHPSVWETAVEFDPDQETETVDA